MTADHRRTHPAVDLLLETIVRCVGLLPRRIAMEAGGILAAGICRMLPRKRYGAIRNARRAGIPDGPRFYHRAAREFGRTTFELMWFIARPAPPLLKGVRVEGLDCLREALAEGRGVLLASGHFGTWDLVAAAAARAGGPVAGTARSWRSRRLENRLIALRRQSGVTTLIRGEPGTGFAAYRWLRDGGIYCCMMDRISSGRRIMVPFLGEGLYVPTGPAEMAERCGAAVVVGFATRLADGTSRVRFRRIHADDYHGSDELAARIGREVERHLLRRPEQWFWIFRRHPSWPGGYGATHPEAMDWAPVIPRGQEARAISEGHQA